MPEKAQNYKTANTPWLLVKKYLVNWISLTSILETTILNKLLLAALSFLLIWLEIQFFTIKNGLTIKH